MLMFVSSILPAIGVLNIFILCTLKFHYQQSNILLERNINASIMHPYLILVDHARLLKKIKIICMMLYPWNHT